MKVIKDDSHLAVSLYTGGELGIFISPIQMILSGEGVGRSRKRDKFPKISGYYVRPQRGRWSSMDLESGDSVEMGEKT